MFKEKHAGSRPPSRPQVEKWAPGVLGPGHAPGAPAMSPRHPEILMYPARSTAGSASISLNKISSPFFLSPSQTLIICRLFFLMVSHKTCRYSSLLFFSSVNGQFQMVCLWTWWFLLQLDLVCCWGFLLNTSVQSLHSSAPEFLFVFYLSLLNLPFCAYIVFLISLNCVSRFSCSSLSIFRTII